MNIQAVKNNLGSIKDIGGTNQASSEDAKKKVLDANVEKVSTALSQLQTDQMLDIQSVSNFLDGQNLAQINRAPMQQTQQLAQMSSQPMQMPQPQQQ
jgi:hypothetical protein